MKTHTVICALALLVAMTACKDKPATVAAAAPAEPAIEHVATAKQVMLGLTIPASDVLFQVGDQSPIDDKGWERIIANAAMLAESGNLLLVGPRNLNQPEWIQLARELVARARDAGEAAAKHDVDAVLEAGNAIYENCDACHSKYMPAKVAEIAAAAAAKP
jgi:hypothetical protein